MTDFTGKKTNINPFVTLAIGALIGVAVAWGWCHLFIKDELTTLTSKTPVAVQTVPGTVAVQPAQPSTSSPPLVLVDQNPPTTPIVVTKPETHKQSCPTACPNKSHASKKAPTAQRPHQAARATHNVEVKNVPTARSAAVATTISISKGVGDTFESIKGGDRECVVYFNGARMYSQFVWGDSVTTKQKCDVFAATMYAKHMHGDSPSSQQIVAVQASPGIATVTATASSSVSTAVVTQVAAASNSCVRAKQKYDCGDKVVVIRPDGAIQCLPPEQAKVSGDQVCTGIQ